MREVYSTDLESTSQIPTWIVLVFSGMALVMFFGWIWKDLSALVYPAGGVNRSTQQLIDSHLVPERGISNNANEVADRLAVNRVDKRVPSDNSLALTSDSNGTIQARKPAANSPNVSTTQPKHTITDPSADGKPEKDRPPAGSTPKVPSDTHEGVERFHYQHPSGELPPSERNVQGVASQEPTTITDEIGDDEVVLSSAQSVESERVALSQDPAAQTDNVDPAGITSADPEPSHTQPSSVDLAALRQLIAEATANNVSENDNASATRKRAEALDSLEALSTAIQFAPGSKVASEPVIAALKKIEMILTDYPDTMISVLVATNESGDDRQDLLLSQERGRTLIAKLVNGGVAFSRFSLHAETDEQLPANTHKVVIQAHLKS